MVDGRIVVEVSAEELVAIDRALYIACNVLAGATLEHVRAVRRRLATAAPAVPCAHCGERPRRGGSEWCKRCTDYRRKYGRLPSIDTLVKSARRRAAAKRRPPGR